LAEVAGIIEAPVHQAADLLLTARTGPVDAGNAWLFEPVAAGATLHGGRDRFTHSAAGSHGTIAVGRTDLTNRLPGRLVVPP
jgi:hypothetical protein